MEKDEAYYNSLDKRTKEYKQWKQNQQQIEQPSQGLGDTIEKITKATGIKKVVKWIFGEDCGCDERRDALNKKFPYAKQLLEEEFDYLTEYYNNIQNKVTVEQQSRVVEIYNRVYGQNARLTSCSPCYKNNIHNKIKGLYDMYKVNDEQ